MRSIPLTVILALPLLIATASYAKQCPADSVQVGDVCVDKYEASVWSTTDTVTIKKIQKGKIAAPADLVAATQHGVHSGDKGDNSCSRPSPAFSH